jgi:hypothetical protein
MLVPTLNKKLIITSLFLLGLTACGGGGTNESPSSSTPDIQPIDPTLTVTQQNTTCEIATECLLFIAEASKNATAATITLSDVDSAVIEVGGERTEVSVDGTVSFSVSLSFKLFVTHSTGESLHWVYQNSRLMVLSILQILRLM